MEFFLAAHGYAQRLPNGNTLITESEGDEVGVGGDEHGVYVIASPRGRGVFYRASTP